MNNIKKVLSELSLRELKELKANPYLIDELIANKSCKISLQDEARIKSFALESSSTRINIPPNAIIKQKAIAEYILKQDGLMFFQLDDELKKDLTLLRLAYQQNPYVLLQVDASLIAQIFTLSQEEIKQIILNCNTKEEILAILDTIKWSSNQALKLKIS